MGADRNGGLDRESREMVLSTLESFLTKELPLARRLELDARSEFPLELVQRLLGPDIGLHLLFLPVEQGGLGGGAFDLVQVSEVMANYDLGVATAFLSIALGTEPIIVGGTSEQRRIWLGRIALEGLIVAYCVTEPDAGSEVAALKTKAEPARGEGGRDGYVLNGVKQFITNGGVAGLYTVLARAPGGPSFFIVESGVPGLSAGPEEQKHGIRASNTSQVILEDLFVPADRLVGGIEGEGLKQASQVFGYTRLMVAAFGLGAGFAALNKAIAYAQERVQFGTTLMAKQGYTHELIVPHRVRLEAGRAYIREVARQIDSTRENLSVEGAVAKVQATRAGIAAVDAALQAHGGYGYLREFEVEKIRRDVRITSIYEGTTEVLKGVIWQDRWQKSIRTKGGYFDSLGSRAASLDCLCPVGGLMIRHSAVVLNKTISACRTGRLTRQQYVQFMLADMMVGVETAAAFSRFASEKQEDQVLAAMARLYAREVVRRCSTDALRIVLGCDVLPAGDRGRFALEVGPASSAEYQAGYLRDLDLVAAALNTGKLVG